MIHCPKLGNPNNASYYLCDIRLLPNSLKLSLLIYQEKKIIPMSQHCHCHEKSLAQCLVLFLLLENKSLQTQWLKTMLCYINESGSEQVSAGRAHRCPSWGKLGKFCQGDSLTRLPNVLADGSSPQEPLRGQLGLPLDMTAQIPRVSISRGRRQKLPVC